MGHRMWKISGFVLVAMLLVFAVLFIRGRRDRKPPEIRFPETEAVYEIGGDITVLYEGVTAFDKKDGDVSSSLLIENVVICDDGENAMVSYAACDSDNNVAKAYRTVKVLRKEEPAGPDPSVPVSGTPAPKEDILFPDEQKK